MLPRILITILLGVCILNVSAGGMTISVAPVFSNLAPVDSAYKSIFFNEGTTVGFDIDVKAPGVDILSFRIGGEYFWKSSAETVEDAEVTSFLVSFGPVISYDFYSPFAVFAGVGAVYITGDYSGAGYFGESIEGEGSSVGFEFTAGLQSRIFGPVSVRVEYRQAFMDITTDRAVIDGEDTNIYPAYATDLGYSQFRISFPVEVFGSETAIF